METLYARCCGLDVHKKTVVACLLTTGPDGHLQQEVRTFGTMTADLLSLADWLTAAECTHVAMESTGVYWKPIYNVLEGLFSILVVNAQHLKAVPGRKTDVKDAVWIATLLRHGLLQGSFIPPREQREVRDLTRYRSSLVQERAHLVNRLQKVLEDANLKLAGVATDITGVSARAMLAALVDGETDPQVLASLARGRLQAKRVELERALDGRVRTHHRFMLTELLAHLDYLDEAIDRFSTELEDRLKGDDEAIELLDTLPGINRRIAEILIAEVGADLSRFPSAGHLASWSGMCPDNHESAGKQKSGKTRKGSCWLRQALIEAAHGAARSKETYFAALFRRIAARRGKKRALVAVGHAVLVAAYHMLTRKEPYRDLGVNYFDERDRLAVERRTIRRLERLGYRVELVPSQAA
ncbi:MAG: IS110 family transposase [Kouleothrix sp.]|nr:IS110 family transposase [Kouleothrix sp.]